MQNNKQYNMKVQDLYKIINFENDNSEIIAMNIVVKDNNSNQLIVYHTDEYGGIGRYNAV